MNLQSFKKIIRKDNLQIQYKGQDLLKTFDCEVLNPSNVYTIESCIALDCYSCYSKNGSDRTCDDPMIRMYKDVIDPVPCVLPTPMKNYQNDRSVPDYRFKSLINSLIQSLP